MAFAPLPPPHFETTDTLYDTHESGPDPAFAMSMYFNTDDMDGEDDGDFQPPSSPKRDSGEEGAGTQPRRRPTRKGKRKMDVEVDEDDEDEFVDDDVEDEDLFLPIEDVPIPPPGPVEDLKEDAMRSLGVDNQAQLVNLINKMVTAGQDGMTPEIVDKLKVLLTLVGPQGMWSSQ